MLARMDEGTAVRRARLATAGAFAAQGLVFISLTTRLPVLKDRWDLGEATLSVLLLAMVLLAGAGSVAAEALAHRHHSAGVLRLGLLVIAVAVPVAVLAPAFWLFAVGLAGYGVGLGLVDASTNMQAVAIEHALGRPVLPSFHGAWTFGGLVGSALTLAVGGTTPAALLAVVPALVALGPFLARARDVDDRPEAAGPEPEVPWRPIVLVGVGMVLFYMVDTASTTWGATYLDQVFATPDRLVALATFPYLLATLVLRLAGDGLVARYGPVRVLRAGTVVAVIALVTVVAAPTWPVAVLGFTLLGFGAAVIAPLSFSAAARIAGGDDLAPAERQARVDVVIGRFNQFNYVGALIGAVLTGLVGADSLRFGFAVPMILIVAMWPLARFFAPDPARVTDALD